MSETENYPGPSHQQPEKEGREAPAGTDEEMVKPTVKTEVENKKEKADNRPPHAQPRRGQRPGRGPDR